MGRAAAVVRGGSVVAAKWTVWDEVMSNAAVPVRNTRERIIQTLAFEIVGLVLITPILSYAAGISTDSSFLLLISLSITVMGWAALYNACFDLAEARIAGRVASERRHFWRIVHAVGLEVSVMVVTIPLIVLMTGLGWLAAAVADIGITLIYAAYGYAFHLGFDRLRPVRQATGERTAQLD